MLGDIAEFLKVYKTKYLLSETAPVIAVGDFYGGALAAFMRMKYPHIVRG